MKRIIIYGTGNEFERMFSSAVGDIMREWMRIHDLSIVGVVSRNKVGQCVSVFGSAYERKRISDFADDSYDHILVTTIQYFEEIKDFLVGIGISEDKITTVESFISETVNDTSKCKYNISVAAIVKDEAAYIEEWLHFHMLMGIEHFYIYDNESSDGTAEILKEYEEMGLVTYVFWPGIAQQVPAYLNAIDRFKNDSIYIAFIDVDEFLFPMTGNSILDEVNRIFDQYKKVKTAGEKEAAAIGVSLRTYGTSFYASKPDDLVMRRFVFRAESDPGSLNRLIKSILNPRAVAGDLLQNAIFMHGYCCISENGSEIPREIFRDGRCEKLRINHYKFKSEEEFIERRKKGDVFYGEQGIIAEEDSRKYLNAQKAIYNEYYDPILVKYSDLIEDSIKKWRNRHMQREI